MSAREEILARITTALVDRPATEPVVRSYHTAGQLPRDGVIELFIERVADYHARVRRCSEDDIARAIAGQVGARSMVVPDGFPSAWLAELTHQPIADHAGLTAARLDELDGVLSVVAIAIADTGTIVLDAGPGQGRRALSLVPDFHCAVVRASQIVASVPDAVAALNPARPLTWISGPSSTSDIELSRVEGVHGPRVLTVIVVD